eukprot:4869425-Pleurochrysis_carterae.AAC.2
MLHASLLLYRGGAQTLCGLRLGRSARRVGRAAADCARPAEGGDAMRRANGASERSRSVGPEASHGGHKL